jgi:putative SOS response-associated peptidase YedK
MCARFSLTASGEELWDEFGLAEVPIWTPRYNIAPSQPVLAVRLVGRQRRAAALRWGLAGSSGEPAEDLDALTLPGFERPPARPEGPLVINARAETAATRPLFREAFASGRCLIPADGFFEWKRRETARQPYRICRRDGRPFAFAGLRGGEGCAILTTEPNALVSGIHDRMPVVLTPREFELWLAPDATRAALEALLRPCDAGDWAAYPVSPRVNRPENDDAACLEPVEETLRGTQGRLF